MTPLHAMPARIKREPANGFGERLASLRKTAGITQTALAAKRRTKSTDTRMQRRLQQIEKLNAAEKRQILQVIDALIERGQLKRWAQSKQAA